MAASKGSNGSGGPRKPRKRTVKPAAQPSTTPGIADAVRRVKAAAAPAPDVQAKAGRNKKGQWTPGTSGHPEGRAKGPSFMAELCRQLEARGDDLGKIILKYLEAAKAGDSKTIMDLADRLDGKPLQRAEVGVTDRGPVLVRDQDFDGDGVVPSAAAKRLNAELDRD